MIPAFERSWSLDEGRSRLGGEVFAMTRLSNETIAQLLLRSEEGASPGDLSGEFGVGRATVFRMLARYGSHRSHVRRCRELENRAHRAARTARRLAKEVDALAGLLCASLPTMKARHDAATVLSTQYGLSERRACQLVGLHRSTKRYREERVGARDTEGAVSG